MKIKPVDINALQQFGQGAASRHSVAAGLRPPGDKAAARLLLASGAGLARSKVMASRQELSEFLESIERRAFKQAVYAVRNAEVALDIVQDAMLKLVEKYPDKPKAEFAPLFQRILQNAIYDHFRRQKVRDMWTTLLSAFRSGDDDDADWDPLDTLEVESGGATESAADTVERDQVLRLIDAEIQKLPTRQREAFLMRYWSELDVAETAAAMGCSEGSVKTHCSRATRTLAIALQAKGITL
jgi:RNA polymerase sigma-70 factor, ECF subfamily